MKQKELQNDFQIEQNCTNNHTREEHVHSLFCSKDCSHEEHLKHGYCSSLFNYWFNIFITNKYDLIEYFLTSFSTIF